MIEIGDKVPLAPPEDTREFRVGDECLYAGRDGIFVVQEFTALIALLQGRDEPYLGWHSRVSIVLLLDVSDDRLEASRWVSFMASSLPVWFR